MKKIFSYVLLSTVLFFGFISITNADITIDFSGNSDNRHRINGIDYNSELHTYYRVTTDNKIAFCNNVDLDYPDPESHDAITWSNCSTYNGNYLKAISYVMKYGYSTPGSTNISNDKFESYFVTQTSLWHFLNRDSSAAQAYANTDNAKIRNLIADAAAANSKSGSVSASVNGNNVMTVTSDGKYYISNAITLKGDYLDGAITASVDNGAFIVSNTSDTTGKTSFNNGDKVYVKILASKVSSSLNVKLSLSAATYLGAGELISCENNSLSEYQGLVYFNPGTKPVSNSINLTASKTQVLVSKTAIAGSKEIPGAKIEVKDSSGTKVESWTSGTTPHSFYLAPGKYTLTETIAPDGYIKSSETLAFEVKTDGVYVNGKKVDKAVMTNEPIKVYIFKTTASDKVALAGAKLKITDTEGKIITDLDGKKLEWASTEKKIGFHLKAGSYILSETEAPKGYELSDKEIKFEVTTDGRVLVDNKEVKDNTIIFKNTPEPEQVPTGSNFIYVIFVGLVSIGGVTYFLYKKNII